MNALLQASHSRRAAPTSVCAVALLLLAGCQNSPGAQRNLQPIPPTGELVSLASTGHASIHVQFMDPLVTASIASLGDRAVVRPDGRLHVEVELKNLTGYREQVQVQCVFLDKQGHPTGDETGWETLFLDEQATETVTFDSLNPFAHTYNIRLRQTR